METTLIDKRIPDDEIIKQLLAELRYSGLKFSEKLGYKSAATIHHILAKRNSISDDLINNVIKNFPEVNYWFLKTGKLPIILDEKLSKNQMNILVGKQESKNAPDYSLEMFATMKNIEVILGKILENLESKK